MSLARKALVSFFFVTICTHDLNRLTFLSLAVEELTCLATWKDGNARYLVGLVTHQNAETNEERYRCFVYEKIQASSGKNYRLPLSGRYF